MREISQTVLSLDVALPLCRCQSSGCWLVSSDWSLALQGQNCLARGSDAGRYEFHQILRNENRLHIISLDRPTGSRRGHLLFGGIGTHV